MKNATRIQWVMLPIAVCAWAGILWFGWSILQDEESRSFRITAVQETQDKVAVATRLRLIMQDTAVQRAQIDALLRTNIVSVVDMLESTGSAGVQVTVSDAHPESATVSRAIAGLTSLVATGFVVEAQGKFTDLIRVVQLLENLPIPSTIGRLEISRDSVSDTGAIWRMSAYVRVLAIPEVRQ